jgi:signal transduction histidine kinase
MGRSRLLAWGSFGFTMAGLAGNVLLAAVGRSLPAQVSDMTTFLGVIVLIVSLAVAGLLISLRFPRNAVGWICGSLAFVLSIPAGAYGVYAFKLHPPGVGAAYAALVDNLAFPVFLVLLVFLVILFPDGRLPSPRWRLAAWAIGISCALWVAGFAFAPDSLPNSFTWLQSPLALPGPFGFPFLVARVFGWFALAGGLLAAALALVMRLVQSRGEARQQLKWLAAAAAFFALTWLGSTVASVFGLNGLSNAIGTVTLPALCAFPIAIGLAIFRYRLYEIDVVIKRALVYGALAAFITAVYVGIVVGLGALINSGGRPNLALSVLATAVVAVAFQPVRTRVQALANRLVYGYRATPYEALTTFSHRVAGTYANEDVLPRLAQVLAEGTGATVTSVWIRRAGEPFAAATWPPSESALDVDRADRVAEVRHQGETLGELTVKKWPGEPFTPVEEKLLNDLAAQAGQVLRNVRLTSELQARLDEISAQAVELRASRQRIVAVQDAERRRLERNIHDGAQQHLVALAVKLRLAATLAKRDPEKARRSVKELEAQTAEARQTVRDLAQGIYPPALREGGLVEALQRHAEVTADGIARYDPEIEAGVYFSCLEALQNASKYAKATSVRVDLRQQGGQLIFSVLDDGVGFDAATASTGTGVQNMKDRVASLGGRLVLESQPGKGTIVSGSLPLAALGVAG